MAEAMIDMRGTFAESERECENGFFQKGPFWHLYTPGVINEIIFRNREDFEFGMNLTGVLAEMFPMIRIITFELMSNHVHFILSGEEIHCQTFFGKFKSRLQRYFRECGSAVCLDRFTPTLTSIQTLQALRNEIVYVNRNGYVANSNCTPYSYYWGAGFLYFNPMVFDLDGVRFCDLKYREKRKILRSRLQDVDFNLTVRNGIVLPSSYCYVREGELYYRDAHHYFNLLSKSNEAMSQIAKNLGDQISVTDEEMYSIASNLSNRLYSVRQPSLVANQQKVELAKKLHYDYNATKRQLRRILRLDLSVLNELFPG